MKVQNRDLLDGFHAWLKLQGCSTRSADSFRSAIRIINDRYFSQILNGKDMIHEVESSLFSGKAVEWLLGLEGFITIDIEKSEGAEKKFLQDKRSKFRKFINFIADLENNGVKDSGSSDETDKPQLIAAGTELYTSSYLKKIFTARILARNITEYRYPVFFPLSAIKKLLADTEKEENARYLCSIGKTSSGTTPDLSRIFREIVKKAVEGIIFQTPNQVYHLNEVEGLLFQASSAQVFVKVKSHSIPLVKADSGKDPVPVKVKSPKGLQLKFVPSIEETLARRRDGFPAFMKLTAMLKSLDDDDCPRLSEAVSILPSLLTELHLIFSNTRITVQ